ncbi:MAG: sulfatase-like hydrolase/transferase [Verrucomicrobiota bacterium]
MALSLANLCCLFAWYYALPARNLDYYKKLPLTQATLLGLVATLFCSAALFWMGIRLWRRYTNRWFRATCEWLFLLLLLIPLNFCRRLWDISDHQVLAFIRQPPAALGLLLLLSCLVWQRRRIVHVLSILAGILSPLAFVALGRVLLVSFGLHRLPQPFDEPPLAPLNALRAGQPRVVWVIFDETDQRLAFEQRPPGLQTPEFDRLRHESLSATNAYPPGTDTIESVPGLLTGFRVSAAVPRNASELELTLADTGQVIAWNKLPSVFDTAREMGINTAVVGWYHPYSRVLGRSLNYCSWYPSPYYQPVRALTLGQAMHNSFGVMAWNLHYRQLYTDICRASLADSVSVATNVTYGLVFLHLAPPHWPGVFNPATGRFTLLDMSRVRAYFNNLALADRTLGTLRRAMEDSGQWDKSWVIVSSDHSWRWSGDYDRRRDLRVPFLVKAPGANKPDVYSPELNTLITRGLILAIQKNQVTNQISARHWLDGHQSDKPPVLTSHFD